MNLAQILLILRARRLLAVLVLSTCLTAAALLSILMAKVYVAEVTLVVDSKARDPVTGAPAAAQLVPNFFATELEVISSRNVALKVVDDLKLVEIPGVPKQFGAETKGAGTIRDWLADKLLPNLTVTPARSGSVIRIGYAGEDPRFAAQLANAFADAYIRTSTELKADPSRRQAAWFDSQVVELRQSLQGAQERLSAFQRDNGIARTDDRLDVENARLTEISTQLVAAQASSLDAQTRLGQITDATNKRKVAQVPDILGNSLLQSMKADLARAQAKLAEAQQRYDRNHPTFQGAAAEVAELEANISAEERTVTGAVRQTAEIATRRASELQVALDAQNARILQLKQQRDQLDILSHDVENAQHTYDASIQRASTVRLEGQLDQSSIAILNPAIAPLYPARPRIALNLIIALVLGSFLGVGAALAVELFDRRVRSREDLEVAGDTILLATIPRLLTA